MWALTNTAVPEKTIETQNEKKGNKIHTVTYTIKLLLKSYENYITIIMLLLQKLLKKLEKVSQSKIKRVS